MTKTKLSTLPTRREFAAAASLASGAIITSMNLSPVHAAGDDTLKVGLIGCGGRGTGAATQAPRQTAESSLLRWPMPSRIGCI